MRNILIILAAFALFFVFWEREQTEKSSLIIGTEPTYPPYETVGKKGELEGFDIDLAKALGKKMKRKIIFKNTSFDALILSLQKGKIDLILSGMSITPERLRQIEMLPYFGEEQKQLTLAFWKKVPADVHSLESLPFSSLVTVQMGTFQENFLRKQSGIEVRSLESNTELIMDLRAGKARAALFETHVAQYMKKRFPELMLLTIPLDPMGRTLGNGMGIRKDNRSLMQELRIALEELKEEGFMDTLIQKWFGR